MKRTFTPKEIAIGLTSLIAVLILISGCSQLNEWLNQKDDWEIEEAFEDVIEREAGLTVDLTPNSPETNM